MIGDKSTLELTVERLLPEFKPDDIFVSTGAEYVEKVANLLPLLPPENIIGEPVKRDVGPAVALMLSRINRTAPHEPVVILWSDHLVKHDSFFKHIVLTAGRLIEREPDKIVFIGQKPRFASENLGWIETGEIRKTEEGINFRGFVSMKYRPDEETARMYFQNSHFCWNLGYFVTTPGFIMRMFQKFSPEIFRIAEEISAAETIEKFRSAIAERYGDMPEINFDKAVLEHLDADAAYVVTEDIGWSDVGAWEALKEALSGKKSDTVTKGRVLIDGSYDSIIYNLDDSKLVLGVDLNDCVVVNTNDVVLVGKKSTISKIKKIVEGFAGTENESLS